MHPGSIRPSFYGMVGLSGQPTETEKSENEDTLVLDMGEFLFDNFGAAELALDHQPGMPALKGINLMQVLPGSLSQRARIFPAIASTHQVPDFQCTLR